MHRSIRRCFLFSFSAALLLADSPVSIQPRERRTTVPAATGQYDISASTQLVLIPVSVTDPLYHPITGLDKSNFRVFDGKVEQQVLNVSAEDSPLAVGLIFDSSASMERKLGKSREAVAEFLKLANPEDEFFLVEFNDRPRLVQSLTSEPSDLQSRLTEVAAQGHTALLDAIALGIEQLRKSEKPRKALLIFSDGGDNRSRASEQEIRNLVRESDVLVYAMGVFGTESRDTLTTEELLGPGLLRDLAEQSGGRMFPANRLQDLPGIAGRIGLEMHNFYVVGYAPSALQNDGKYHRVQVKLVPPTGVPGVRVAWRPGYYAPR